MLQSIVGHVRNKFLGCQRYQNFLAIPLWNLVAFFLLNDMTFLGRNMITYLFIYELAVLLSDDLTSSFRAKNALFLMALTANFLETRVTLLIVFSLAILLMDCFVNPM